MVSGPWDAHSDEVEGLMDKTPEMVERVAMALDQCRSNFIALRLIDKTPDYDIDEALARAAIEAMRVQSREMWAGWRSINCRHGTDGMKEFTYFYGDYGNWLACHNRMIDAALG